MGRRERLELGQLPTLPTLHVDMGFLQPVTWFVSSFGLGLKFL